MRPAALGSNELTFQEACHFLGLSAADFSALREQGLVAIVRKREKQLFPRRALLLTARLLALGRKHGWSAKSIAWFADLAFASEVGRVVLLPLPDVDAPSRAPLPASWLETSYANALLQDMDHRQMALEEPMRALTRSLLSATIGPGHYWEDNTSLAASAIMPVIDFLSGDSKPSLLEQIEPARESGHLFALLVLAFSTLAAPISAELKEIVQAAYAKLRAPAGEAVPSEEQERILRERLIAVDRLYATKATEIHTPMEAFDVSVGVLTTARRTIALQLKLPINPAEAALDNILDVIRPYLGTYGARVVQALYEIANDPPNWRNPIMTVDTNQLLDRLGEKRDSRKIHYSRNRVRLRDTLNAAHNLEIVGEFTTWESGVQVRKAIRRPVLSLIGATFDVTESSSLTTEELFQKGLPKSMQVRLNFYDGVRKSDGELGDQYILVPRLVEPHALTPANYSGTHERLRQHLLLRCRQAPVPESLITLTRETALREAGITNSNVTRATQTLEKALMRLVELGILVSFTPVPLRPQEAFACIVSDTFLREPQG